MEEKNERFEAVEPLEAADGTCVHASAHTHVSANAEGGVRSVLVLSSHLSMRVMEGALQVRFAWHEFSHARPAEQLRR